MADDKRKDPDDPDTDAVSADDSASEVDQSDESTSVDDSDDSAVDEAEDPTPIDESDDPDPVDESDDPEPVDDAKEPVAGTAVRTRASMPKRKSDAVAEDTDEGGGVITKRRDRSPKAEEGSERTGVLTFIKQCVDELRKVVWPTGDQWRQYFVVVLVFVVVMIAYASLLDLGLGALLLRVFG